MINELTISQFGARLTSDAPAVTSYRKVSATRIRIDAMMVFAIVLGLASLAFAVAYPHQTELTMIASP